jgi:hypothetical protein
LFSASLPSSPDMLKDEDVNMSGTGNIDGLRFPIKVYQDWTRHFMCTKR